ncbi:phosphoglycerate kinase [Oceanicola sp. 502str15]|uniref:phosphoglycerate kinase n=1 Tax=Oceanicola sp. 502str15 TaxID=2696061 RepID=UPI002094438F|nr:phosphoglycerate kinase [Oceanicola sp. 502str15]MCO6381901.1 phosphoglycerate kinase [Oceanicola sp. 502str15]
MPWKTLDDMDLKGKRVLVRVDINVPVEDGKVTDTTRIDRIVPTVQDILAKGGKPILLAHFGRPKGKVVPEMSLEIVVPALSEALGRKVAFAEGGWDAAVATLSEGQVLLLENMRFFPGEEANDPEFAKELAALGDIYCNDAFSAAHRAHASTEGVAHLLPSCAGRNMQEELEALEGALGDPIRPVAAVVGGAKVSTKITLLSNLLDKVDHLIIGGGMANTFLLAQGHEIGQSLAEAEMADTALEILEKAKGSGCTIHLPVDVVVAEEFKARAPHKVYPAQECPSEGMILDAGPKTVANICEIFDSCETVIWNGPLGAFEIMPFGAATYAAARQAGALTDRGELITVAGGGDTVAALNNAKASYQFTYISTAGGAFLEWMEGKPLPGVAALDG